MNVSSDDIHSSWWEHRPCRNCGERVLVPHPFKGLEYGKPYMHLILDDKKSNYSDPRNWKFACEELFIKVVKQAIQQ